MWPLRFIQKKIGGAMRCLTTTAFPSRAQIQEAPFTKIGRDTVRSMFMRTSLPLAYKSVRTLRRAGLDYASPAPLRVTVFMVTTAAGDAPLLPASPAAVAGTPRARSAPGLRLSHFRLAPRNSTRLARGPKGSWGAARWRRRFGEG